MLDRPGDSDTTLGAHEWDPSILEKSTAGCFRRGLRILGGILGSDDTEVLQDSVLVE